ncbi:MULTISPECIES: hypothetical protein [unclassified Variovorax]|nr:MULTISPECIES: hypothetical protein [unclassified Variovorax]VTU42013.1 hypothetical protein SRS16P1_00175 [Variovorax sp. SRS16]VTU42048.1 hypothetical protein E5P1_00173 [Variovorax sp. PBL-E5]KWT95531.1 hypothetical protein APY03_2408 [Variovorax sp. WDL1]PNG50135.1 hypothetical protein CHC06_05758 [Variovorax sp. B2]PNG51008.1 hypothetical protein CHC07_05664 [Variovorax sp. B4]
MTSSKTLLEAKAPLKPKPTAAERSAALVQRKAAEAAAEAERIGRFETERPVWWLRIWAKALRLSLLARDHTGFRDAYSWWFDDFRVDAVAQSFHLESTGGRANVHAESGTAACEFEQIDAALDRAITWFDEYLAEQERLRQAELERQEHRKRGLEKLTDAEKSALGLIR